MVLRGTIELTVGPETFVLREGDSFSFSSKEPHRYYNPGQEVAMVIWANTPITLRP